MKLFWTINVFSQVKHLHFQQDLIREAFGDDVQIAVFCNNERVFDDLLHKEDHVILFKKNSGHHNGVKDCYNTLFNFSQKSALLEDSDVMLFSHADAIFNNYRKIMELVTSAHGSGKKAVILNKRKFYGCHLKRDVDFVFNDFFSLTTDVFNKLFPLEANCDVALGIEGELGKKLYEEIDEGDIRFVSCNLIGKTFPHDDSQKTIRKPNIEMFEHLDGVDGFNLYRDHDLDLVKKMLT